MPVINAHNVSMSYEGKKVIEGISFSVNQGDCLCIAGENGSGKTTLLKALTGLKKIDSGSLAIDVKSCQVGYLPQQTEIQRDFPASVYEVVLSGAVGSLGFKPFYTKKEKDAAKVAMKRLGIESLSHKCYHELSGGQQQKVLLARSICASKTLIIMDEPTTSLDKIASEEFYALIKELTGEGITVIMISHDISSALRYSSHVLHLGEKKQLYFGTADDYALDFLKGGCEDK